VSASAYPQIAVYGSDGAVRSRIDCLPTTRPGIYLANEPIDAMTGEPVVIALDPAALDEVESFGELRAAH